MDIPAEELYRHMVELSPDSIITVDTKGVITSCNATATKMLRYSEDEMVGKHFSKIGVIRARDLPKYLKIFNSVLRKKATKPLELTFYRKDGTPLLAEVRVGLLKSAGKTIGLQAISRDITERKKMEENLRKSEKKFKSIFRNANDCMIQLNSSGRILDVNKKATEVFGGSRKELLGRHFTEIGLFSPGDTPKLLSAFAKGLAGKQSVLDVHIKNSKGRDIFLEGSASPMKIDDEVALMVVARDITERKNAEKSVRESEQRLRDVIDTSPDGIVWIDTTGNMTLVNRKVLEVTGFSEKYFVGKNFMDIKAVTQESKEKILKNLVRRLEGADIPPYEVEVVTKTGEVLPFEISASPIYEGDKIVGVQAIFRDLRERKKAEEALRESEAKFRKLAEQSPNMIFINKKGRVVYANKKCEEATGYTKKYFYSPDFDFFTLIAPESTDLVKTNFSKHMKGKEVAPYEYTLVTKEGRRIDALLTTKLIKYEGATAILGTATDITERKKMEEKLRQYSEHLEELVQKRTEELLESEKRYSVLVEEASDGVGIIQDGKVVFINKRGAEIIGYSKEELLGLPFERVVDERIREQTRRLYAGRMQREKVPAAHEIVLIAKNGERVPVEVSGTLVNYQGRPADLAIVRDIRERKRMEEERLKLEKLAAIGEVATMVGHDLRNPLQSIEIATYYLNNELPHLYSSTSPPKRVENMLKVLSDSVNYADKIVRDLRDFSATKKLKLEKTNPNTIIKETLSKIEIPENVRLITKLGSLPEMEVDKDMIERVFLNLTLNGTQAMIEGGTLEVSTKRTRGLVEVSFRDTGVGIPKEDIAKIFTPFFTRKAKGMGMGLAICRRFVDSHGGSIGVESEEGRGSTFTVRLPITRERR